MGTQAAQYTPSSSFLKKHVFWKFHIFQNQENSRKTSRKGPCTLLWSLKGPSTTLVDMQTAQDTSVYTFLVTDVRHASVSVHILLEWEISRKSSGKPYFTAVLGVTIQPRTLWWISILFRTPWHWLAAAFRVERYAFCPEDARQCSAGHGQPRQEVQEPPTPPSPPSPHLFGRTIQRLLGQPSQMNN